MRKCTRFLVQFGVLAVLLWTACAPAPAPTTALPENYVTDVEAWRQQRQDRLRSPDGWLTLVGLHWLEPGDNRFGSAPDCDVRFPDWASPAEGGVLTLSGDGVRVTAAPGVALEIDGTPAETAVLAADSSGKANVVTLGDLSFHVIERGGRLGIRSKHPDHPALAAFEGTEWYPVDPAYRVVGRLQPYDPPREVDIPNVLGTVESMLAPGVVHFTLGGVERTLRPVVGKSGDTKLFFIFKDATSGRGTYRPGRFLYGDLEPDGTVVVDFNRAYNPPCAFTPYATCPLPPRENWLDTPVEAGEKDHGDH